mgnify:CR=1 FL=1
MVRGERSCAEGLDGLLGKSTVEKFTGTREHDLGEVEDAHDGRERDPQALARVAQHAGGGFVGRRDPGGQCGDRQPRLETADLAARAPRATVGSDGDVTDLARGESSAAQRLRSEGRDV